MLNLDEAAKESGLSKSAVWRAVKVYSWFTEGFDTPVLEEAKVLLDQLA